MDIPTKVLIIGSTWPESNATAAGVRTWGILRALKRQDWQITFATGAKENDFADQLRAEGIGTAVVQPNDPAFDRLIQELRPDFAIFDRFPIEEQFSWRVREHSPGTARILDTQDLHFLRRTRERALRAGEPLEQIFRAELDFSNHDACREIAAIFRSDLTWILSSFELTLLRERFHVPESLLALQGFHYAPTPAPRSYSERKNFVMIGNFRHPPNADAVLWVRAEIWPRIREALPDAELHVYGSYPAREHMSLTQKKDGFIVRGPADNQYETLAAYRVNLAPLRFGAGIKGKISDAWWCGTPVVTTPIGQEGMTAPGPWGGLVAETPEAFAEAAVKVYRDQALWTDFQQRGFRLLEALYDEQTNSRTLMAGMLEARKDLAARREGNFIGQMLWHQTLRSTEYFSRWIEAKNATVLKTKLTNTT